MTNLALTASSSDSASTVSLSCLCRLVLFTARLYSLCSRFLALILLSFHLLDLLIPLAWLHLRIVFLLRALFKCHNSSIGDNLTFSVFFAIPFRFHGGHGIDNALIVWIRVARDSCKQRCQIVLYIGCAARSCIGLCKLTWELAGSSSQVVDETV